MEVVVTEQFAASGGSIWELLRDFGGILRWNPSGIESVTVEGEGIGAVRTIGIPGGIQLQEKLEAHNDDERSFSYSFTGKLVIPLDDYYATMTVVDESDSSCRVDWKSTFQHPSMDEASARKLVEGIYQAGFAALKQTVEG